MNNQSELIYAVTTAPAVPPVTVAEAKGHLRVTHADDDAKIGLLIDAATEYVEKQSGRALITQTIKLYLQCFPATDAILLPRTPAQSITSIKYNDADGDQQTLVKDTVWAEDVTSEPPRAVLMYGQSWPSIRADRNAIIVEFVAGYGDAATDVPEDVRQAVFLLVGDYYSHRMSQTEQALHRNEVVDDLLGNLDRRELV